MANSLPSYYHVHLVSDATGETLTTLAKAASVQYPQARAMEHFHPLVRAPRQLKRVLQEIEQAPGIVLYTLVNPNLVAALEERCQELNVPCFAALKPIMQVFESYLGAPQTPTVAGQHVLDADYFRRIEALNFTMAHDDGRLPEDLNAADIILLGISRTSKTPTSIYLALRGYKTANVPIVPQLPFPVSLTGSFSAFVVCLVASPDRISEVRRNRTLQIGDTSAQLDDYTDKRSIAAELAYSRKLCTKHKWPIIDVTRRSVEETAAAIIRMMHDSAAGESATDIEDAGHDQV